VSLAGIRVLLPRGHPARRNGVERCGTPHGRGVQRRLLSTAASCALARSRRGVIGMEIVLVESEADRIDPELVRHVP
jgi:hypothetical protein